MRVIAENSLQRVLSKANTNTSFVASKNILTFLSVLYITHREGKDRVELKLCGLFNQFYCQN